MLFLLFVPTVLHLVARAIIKLSEKGVDLLLALAFALLVLEPFAKITTDKDLPIDHGRIACEAPVYASQTNISVMDANRLSQMERRRDDRISVVQKGRRRQGRQKQFNKTRSHQELTSPSLLPDKDAQTKFRNRAFHLLVALANGCWEPI